MPLILVVDNQTTRRAALRRALVRQGYQVAEARSVHEAEQSCGVDHLDLIVARLRLPDGPGTQLIQQCAEVPVLIVTGYPSVQSAVEAMRLGAVDYVPKPFSEEELVPRVAQALQHHGPAQGQSANRAMDLSLAATELILKGLRNIVDRVASTDTTVLILGEYGSGKTLVARAIHESSKRRNAPMVTLNCVAMPEGALQASLFGRREGSVARKSLDAGTLFLDGIDELQGPEQSHLLRFVRRKTRPRAAQAPLATLGGRVLAAAHQDLPVLVAHRRYSAELYLRLHVAEIRIPPLRERGDDVVRLAEHFLAQTCARLQHGPMRLSADAIDAVKAYTWPGNLRELQNAIEQAVILSDSAQVSRELLGLDHGAAPQGMPGPTDTVGRTEPAPRNNGLLH